MGSTLLGSEKLRDIGNGLTKMGQSIHNVRRGALAFAGQDKILDRVLVLWRMDNKKIRSLNLIFFVHTLEYLDSQIVHRNGSRTYLTH